MSKLRKSTENANSESATNRFVPATQWDAMRKRYPAKPSRARGLRALSQAMTSENPENSVGMESAGGWRISPSDCSPDDEFASIESEMVLERAVAELDACFASEGFLDDLDWALQTYDLRQHSPGEAVNMDDELEILEAVQDLTRFLARTTPQRSQQTPATPSIPD